MNHGFVTGEERVASELRALFSRFGYTPFKMRKFEDYDLYVRFKDYLISDHIITFTDGGKLLALKPDVTLSLIRSVGEEKGQIYKLYYQENVYRRTRPDEPFREILQSGLECIGDLDDYNLGEVLSLAAQSLRLISQDAVLVLSHLGLLKAFVDPVSDAEELRGALMALVGEKNLPGIRALARDEGLDQEAAEELCRLLSLTGAPEEVLPPLRKMAVAVGAEGAFAQLESAVSALSGTPVEGMLRLDLSAVSDGKYYNDLVFRGFVKGLPERVLSGGQYDKLMGRMGKKSRAVGFAVYLDQVPLLDEEEGLDADVLILYDAATPAAEIRRCADKLRREGKSVLVLPQKPQSGRFGEIVRLGGEGL